MKIFKSLNDPEIINLLKSGAVGVLPTDTIYGIVASVWSELAVNRLYKIRQRDQNKPCIVLIASLDQIADKSSWREVDYAVANRYWPGQVTIVFSARQTVWPYLPRNDKTLAYRLPNHPSLQEMLSAVGPIIAPSANAQGQPAATSIEMAVEYFGESVDFYVDGGDLVAEASTIIKSSATGLTVLRQGVVAINQQAGF